VAVIEIANHLIDSITDRFFLLTGFPHIRDEDFGPACRRFSAGEYVILYEVRAEDVLILRVAHGRRDLDNLFPR